MSEKMRSYTSEKLEGTWVYLELATEQFAAEIEELDRKSEEMPQMGGIMRRQVPGASFGGPMLIRVKSTSAIAGIIANQAMDGYEGIGFVSFYIDRKIINPRCGVEAGILYIDYMFQMGTRKVYVETLEFNTSVFKFLEHSGLPIRARLRESYYIAGRFWDLLIFEFDQLEWEIARERFRPYLPRQDS